MWPIDLSPRLILVVPVIIRRPRELLHHVADFEYPIGPTLRYRSAYLHVYVDNVVGVARRWNTDIFLVRRQLGRSDSVGQL